MSRLTDRTSNRQMTRGNMLRAAARLEAEVAALIDEAPPFEQTDVAGSHLVEPMDHSYLQEEVRVMMNRIRRLW